MRVLITTPFNEAMRHLDETARNEVGELFAMATSTTRDQLTSSGRLIKLESAAEDVYTLRTRNARVFCAFDASGDLLFLDVKAATFPTLTVPSNLEVTLFNSKGKPQAYISADAENTIYSFAGRPLAYLKGENIYGFNGNHLGWYEDDIVWDHKGRQAGFTSKTCPTYKQFQPFKGFKQFRPFKGFKKRAPPKPHKQRHTFSEIDLIRLLEGKRL